MDADLLIFECTFENQRAVEAKSKMHSTFAEGVRMGMRMRAKKLLLTHFHTYNTIPSIVS